MSNQLESADTERGQANAEGDTLPRATSKAIKKRVKKKELPQAITEEYILEQRKIRAEKKARKAEEKANALALDPSLRTKNDFGFDVSFKSQPMLPLFHNRVSLGKAGRFTLMTYNILAQTLIRRKLFPTCGEAVKWKNRQQVLKSQFLHYLPSIFVAQEVGIDMMKSLFDDLLKDKGYQYEFYHGEKKAHGLLLAFNQELFELISKQEISFDDLSSIAGADPAALSNRTRNVGLCATLRHKSSQRLLTIGTTHLFWHPRGTVERARQVAVLIEQTLEIDRIHGQGNIFLAGDLNTEPLDPTYKAIVSCDYKIEEDQRGLSIMRESVAYANLFADDEDTFGEAGEEGVDDIQLDENNTEVNKLAALEPWECLIERLRTFPDFASVYGKYYKTVHENNVAEGGEPCFTNYANVYRGTLDYIMTIQSMSSEIRPTALLRLPEASELTDGLPQEKENPSDHLPICVEFAFE